MIEKIIKVVTDYRNILLDDFQSKTRKEEVVQARQEAHYFAEKLTSLNLKYIGSKIGGKDYSTVIYSCKTITKYLEVNRKYKEELEAIEKLIKPVTPIEITKKLELVENKIAELIGNSDPNDEKSIEGVELVINKVKEIYENNSLFLKQENENRI